LKKKISIFTDIEKRQKVKKYILHGIQQLIHLQLQAKSKGGRLVSAIIAIRKNKKAKINKKKLGRTFFLDNK
jgi:hypothetical protein